MPLNSSFGCIVVNPRRHISMRGIEEESRCKSSYGADEDGSWRPLSIDCSPHGSSCLRRQWRHLFLRHFIRRRRCCVCAVVHRKRGLLGDTDNEPRRKHSFFARGGWEGARLSPAVVLAAPRHFASSATAFSARTPSPLHTHTHAHAHTHTHAHAHTHTHTHTHTPGWALRVSRVNLDGLAGSDEWQAARPRRANQCGGGGEGLRV